MGGKCAFSTYYDELKSLYSWKCFANTLDIISQMKENSQGYYHELWRKTNFKDMYCNLATMSLVFKNSGKIAVHFRNGSQTLPFSNTVN